jgi:hypothetical protein
MGSRSRLDHPARASAGPPDEPLASRRPPHGKIGSSIPVVVGRHREIVERRQGGTPADNHLPLPDHSCGGIRGCTNDPNPGATRLHRPGDQRAPTILEAGIADVLLCGGGTGAGCNNSPDPRHQQSSTHAAVASQFLAEFSIPVPASCQCDSMATGVGGARLPQLGKTSPTACRCC